MVGRERLSCAWRGSGDTNLVMVAAMVVRRVFEAVAWSLLLAAALVVAASGIGSKNEGR